MNKSELRKELDELVHIFLSAKLYYLDFKYLHLIKNTLPSIYSTYKTFIDRMYYASCVIIILNFNKLLSKRDKSGFWKFKNRLTDNYHNSEIKEYLSISEINILINDLYSEKIVSIISKIETTRDEYYAHFDKNRTDFDEIKINALETDLIISKSEIFLKNIELKYFDLDRDYSMTERELGCNLFEELEKYRFKRMDSNHKNNS